MNDEDLTGPGEADSAADLIINRREFLELAGSGIFLFFVIGELPAFAQEGPGRRPPVDLPTDFNAFLRIGPDGRVSCYTGKIEMGQGVITSLAQELADELDRRAAAAQTEVRVLVQVNVAREPQKAGCDPDGLSALVRAVRQREHLRLEGLMTMAPFTDDVAIQRRTFHGLRTLRDALQEEGVWVPTLSMGMSADFATAVEEGATAVRLGTVLFGPRMSP